MSHSLLSARSCSACSSTPPTAILNLRRPAVWIVPAAGRFHVTTRGARQALFGIGRQIDCRELSGGEWRDADAAHPRRDKTIAAFDAAREGIGVELRAQAIDAGDGDGAVGGDVLPAIGQRAGDIGRADLVFDEGTGLEQVRAAGATIDDAEIGAAAGQGKSGN